MRLQKGETEAWLLSRIFFAWTIPILWRGNQKELCQDEIPNVQANDATDILVHKFGIIWSAEVQGNQSSPSLKRALFKTFGLKFIVTVLIVCVQQWIIRISIPILLGYLIEYVDGAYSNEVGYILASVFIVVIFLNSLIQQRCWFALDHLGMNARIAVTGLIFQKIFRLSTTTVRTTGVGQLTNIISNDVNRFDRLKDTPYIITVPFQILFVALVLWHRIGMSAMAGIAVLILIIPVQGYLARSIGKWRAVIADKTDRRVRLLAEVLSGILLIKMNTWEKPYTEAMTEARGSETKCIKRKNTLMALNYSLFDITPKMCLLATFLTYTYLGGTLSAESVFVTLAMYTLVGQSASIYFPQGMSAFSEVLVSIRRIENVLLLEEKQEYDSQPNHLTTESPRIRVTSLSAKWDPEVQSPKIIQEISFEIKSGEFLGIIGAVGSGKSSLLLAVLGEMCPVSGNVEINGKVAYAPQDPWIFTGSLRDNILFGLPYDPHWYAKVVEACAMTRDLDRFVYGDQTLVGDRGMNLSGGQKARISLARAIYSQADIYLLDDPLSSVDARVAVTLMDKCIRGVLKEKCVIMVTHQTEFLREATEIISLQKGGISARGVYQALFPDDGIDSKNEASELSGMSIDQLLEAADEADATNSKSVHSDVIKKRALKNRVVDEVEETHHMGRVGWKTYSNYFRSGNSIMKICFILLLAILSQVTINGSDLWLRKWTDAETNYLANSRQLQRNESEGQAEFLISVTEIPNHHLYLYVYAGMIGAVLLVSLIKTTRTRIFSALASSSVELYKKLFESIIRAPMRFFEVNSTGRIMNRFSTDIGNIDEILPQRVYIILCVTIFLVMALETIPGIAEVNTLWSEHSILSKTEPRWFRPTYGLFLALVMCLGSIGVIIYLSLPLAVPTFILLIVFYCFIKLYIKPCATIKRLESRARSPIFGQVSTSLTGLPLIRAYGVQSQFYNQFINSQNIHTKNFYMYLTSCRWLQLSVEMATSFYVTTVLLYLLHTSTSSTAFGLGIASVLALATVVTPGMTQAAEMINSIVCVERVIEYSDVTPEAPSLISKYEFCPLFGSIQFSGVQVLINSQKVLNEISVHIKPGEKIGIVGRTGAGKTTLISTLFRIVEANEGKILVDNMDISCIGLEALRQKLSIIPQTPTLFSGTIRRNIDPFSRHSDADIWAALQSVQLTQRLLSQSNVVPEILSTEVSEGGSNFSQGERQLICLARTILEKNKIVVLDEATASMDKETDSIIQETLQQNFSNSTLLIIAHRLDTVIETDRILFLDNGMIKEFDEPRFLLEDESSFLYKLVQSTGESNAQRLRDMVYKSTEITDM